jgi:hypothetical protein
MNKLASAYEEGMADALDRFGVRMASELARRRMPEGPKHLGAERLAKMLGGQQDNYSIGDKKPRRNLERPVRFGEPTSLEGAGVSSVAGLPGAGAYGGV